MTQGEMVFAYAEARRARVPVAAMGRVERAGYYLLLSARKTDDGEPRLADALSQALLADEVDVAVELSDRFIPEVEVELDPRYRRRHNFRAAGEISSTGRAY